MLKTLKNIKMKLWKNFAFAIVLIALIVSCGTYRQAPENTIKVLAVTSEGDTIQLDVNSLRPRVYQTIYHSYPYYYNYWRPSPFYFGSNYYYQGSVIRPNYRPNNSLIHFHQDLVANTCPHQIFLPRPLRPIRQNHQVIH